MVTYYYRSQPAVDRDGERIAAEGAGQIYAVTDTTFATPLTFALDGGTTANVLPVSGIGQTAAFSIDDHAEVLFKSGDIVSPLVAWSSVVSDAKLARDQATVAATEAAASVAELETFRRWIDLGITQYNLLPNPRLIGVDSRSGAGATMWTQADMPTGGPDGRSWSAHTLTANQSGNVSIGSIDLANAATAGVIEGQTYCGSVYVRTPRATTARVRIATRDAADAIIGTPTIGDTVSIPAGVWTRLSASTVVPVGGVKVIVFPEIIGTALLSGDVLGVAQRMLTSGATLRDYFDGGTSTTDSKAYAWEGAVDASRSKLLDMAAISSDLVEAAQAAQAAAESLEAGVADWDALQNKPGVFPPAPHSHAAADIASGTVAPQHLGTGTRDGSRYLRDDGTWQVPPGTGGGGGGASSWDELLGKPSTFPPSSHSHPASQISDSSPLGRTVLTTSDPTTARNAIGAGTSSVTVGGSTTGAAAPASHSHSKADVGLALVDNTADVNKPVSVLQAQALAGKADSASLASLAGSVLRFVDSVTGSEPRPSGAGRVVWIGGATQPVNMAVGDVWWGEAA